VTEIPEHLLKRSRAAKGKPDGDDAPASTSVEAAGAAPAAAAPAGPPALAKAAASISPDAAPAPAAPEPAYIQAAKQRKKLPLWAFFILGFVPLWAISFAGTMQQPEVADPLFEEAALVYAQTGGCAGCHGAGGGGGVGYAFTNGEVMATFPEAIDQMVHVARGSAAILGEQYGDPNRPGGAHVSGARGRGAMPAMAGVLTMAELELVIFHERAVLGGEDMSSAAYQEWMEHLREAAEEPSPLIGDEEIDMLLACANPEYTPGATGIGLEGDEKCPGPELAGAEEVAAG
jgi:mono/diheme cytochrome c family protein